MNSSPFLRFCEARARCKAAVHELTATTYFDSNVIFWFYECALLSEMGFAIDINNQDINGLNISKKKGTKSYQILNDILSRDYEKIKNIKYSLKDKNIISEYLFKQLSYHFEGFYKLKSFKVAKKILTKN